MTRSTCRFVALAALVLSWALASAPAFAQVASARTNALPGAIGRLAAEASLAAADAAVAPATTGFVKRLFKDDDGDHKYTVFVPKNYKPGTPTPTIVFLHGAGERGRDGDLPLVYGLAPYIKAREATFPFLAVFAQVEDTAGPIKTAWYSTSPDGQRLMKILAAVEADYTVDAKHLILSGWSMGGYGAWELAAAYPEKWSAVIPMAAGAPLALTERLKSLPIWAFHGAKDTAVPVRESRNTIAALRAAGGQPRYTEYPLADHEVWIQAFGDDRLFAWMLAPAETSITDTPLRTMPTSRGTAVVTAPWSQFVPVLDIPNSLYVRVGNDLMSQISAELPRYLTTTSFSGSLPNVSQSTEVSGVTFNITFSGLSYSAQLISANLRAVGPNRVSVALGLSNGQVTIGGTSVVGSGRKSASAGPIGIYMARQAPVYLRFELSPRIEGRQIRLSASNASFSIPPNDFSVSNPAGISTSGLFMDAETVSSSLVNGLYGSRGQIEQQVIGVVPQLVSQIEQQLNGYIGQGDKLAAAVWPLPVYQPALRIWPSDIAADAEGLTLCLGVTASSINPAKPMQWVIVPPAAPGASAAPKLPGLSVGVSPQAVKPLSQLMIVSDVSRIHVQDTPTETLPLFVDRAKMVEVFPDLARYGDSLQLRAELVIADAISVSETKQDAGLVFDVPGLRVEMSLKPDAATKTWQRFANFDIAILQNVEPRLRAPAYNVREFLLDWAMPAKFEVKGAYLPDYKPMDETIQEALATELFTTGWREFTTAGADGGKSLADLEMNGIRLRAAKVAWTKPYITAQFAAPGMRISNRASEAVTYQTRANGSAWSQDWKLAPGEFHDYPVPYGIQVRQMTPMATSELNLPPGSEFEFLKVDDKVNLFLAPK